MIISITSEAKANGRPTSIGSNNLTIGHGSTKVFSVADFTTDTVTQYSDPEGDAMAYIKVISIPSPGELILNVSGTDEIVHIGDLIQAGDISTGNLKYISDNGEEGEYTDSFAFDIADAGSQSLSGLSSGSMNLTIEAKINYPPDVVGNKTFNIQYGTGIIFEGADFTSGTTPAYNDPEGDEPYAVKIISLPVSGTLYFNRQAVVVNQEMLVSEIDAGYLSYLPNLGTIAALTVTFEFAVSDSGSREFTQ